MKYEQQFRIKELEIREDTRYSHRAAVNELANVVKEADNYIEDLEYIINLHKTKVKDHKKGAALMDQLCEENFQYKVASIVFLGLTIASCIYISINAA